MTIGRSWKVRVYVCVGGGVREGQCVCVCVTVHSSSSHKSSLSLTHTLSVGKCASNTNPSCVYDVGWCCCGRCRSRKTRKSGGNYMVGVAYDIIDNNQIFLFSLGADCKR